jgi:FkbM family methyltransferase
MDLEYVLRKFKRMFIKQIKQIINLFGLEIIKLIDYENMQKEIKKLQEPLSLQNRLDHDQLFIKTLSDEEFLQNKIAELISNSKSSELHQDVLVLLLTNFQQGLYFVEFGAADGFNLSNTFLLEEKFSWQGILAEPAKIFGEDLKRNRPNSNISLDCVWSDSNSELIFNETPDAPFFSTLFEYRNSDSHHNSRKQSKRYKVKTISMNDLLTKYNAPNHINYLSIDTEGSEYKILSSLDWNRYSFDVITCEHNYSSQREDILRLLTNNGYKRIFEFLSLYEDWYIKI